MAGAPTVFLTCEIKLHAKDIKEERKTECPTPMMLSYLSWKKNIFKPLYFVSHDINSQIESWNQKEK